MQAQKAVQFNRPCLSNMQCTVCYNDIDPASPEAVQFLDLFKDRPALGNVLISKLRAMLAVESCAPEADVGSGLVVDTRGCKVRSGLLHKASRTPWYLGFGTWLDGFECHINQLVEQA